MQYVLVSLLSIEMQSSFGAINLLRCKIVIWEEKRSYYVESILMSKSQLLVSLAKSEGTYLLKTFLTERNTCFCYACA